MINDDYPSPCQINLDIDYHLVFIDLLVDPSPRL